MYKSVSITDFSSFCQQREESYALLRKDIGWALIANEGKDFLPLESRNLEALDIANFYACDHFQLPLRHCSDTHKYTTFFKKLLFCSNAFSV